MAKKKGINKNNVIRVVISIIYIALGIGSVFSALSALLALDLIGILTSAVGVIMFLAGLFGLLKVRTAICRTFGIIIFIAAGFTFVWSLIKGNFQIMPLVQALLAWLFIAVI